MLNKTQYNIRYARYVEENLKRIPLDVQKEIYEDIKVAATTGETINGYIKTAISQRMQHDIQATPSLNC